MVVGEVDLAITVHLPPEGMVWNYDTGKLEPCEVIQRSLIKSEQYWEAPKLPDNYAKKVHKEKQIQKLDSSYVDPELQKYRAREWHRRKYGVWFMNNGKMLYLTGLHYFYLTHWHIDIGLPTFRYPDLKKAYFTQYCVEDPNCFGMVEITKRRNGKCFGINTPIRMYDGSVKMVQDIVEGDLVMGDDSTPRRAYGITSGEEEMFEIIPNKGDPWSCNKSHILSLIWNNTTKHSVYGWEPNSKFTITVGEYINLKNWEKEHIVMYRNGWGNHYPHQKHMIPPYIIGCFLGDGVSLNGMIANTDEEVLSEFREYAGTLDSHDFKKADNVCWRISTRKRGPDNQLRNDYLAGLRDLDLISNKHIPKKYLLDSRENRLELLAGIIDTDGHLTKGNTYEVIQKNEFLAEDITELARSLGFYVNNRHKVARMTRKNGTVYSCDVRRMTISGNIHEIPCRIKRKKCKIANQRQKSNRTGFVVKPEGIDFYFGFAVDDNHLFLLADGTVVHNTFWGGAFITERSTRLSNSWGGIQSKTESDAKSVFSKAVIQPFRKLPDFFKPEYDRSQGDVPKRELRFFKTSKRGETDISDYDATLELESVVNFRNSKPEAYDGEKLISYLCDEVFKTKDVNVLDRHDIVKPCFLDSDGRTILGKAIYTSTVEDMEGYMEHYMELWENSDHSKKKSNGQTKSGLYRYFTPAQDMMYLDKFGYPDSKKGLDEIMQNRIDLADDPRALASYIRKNPTTWKEAFRTSGDECLYNAIKIDERLDILNWKKDNYERYDLIWESEEKRNVKLVKNRHGRFKFSWTFESAGIPDQANHVQIRGANVIPKNILRFVIGIDPYDHNRTKNGKFSNGAAAVFMKFDAMSKDDSDNFVCTYVARPQTAQLFYEDMIKLCHYFGCQMLFEDNKPGIKTYFHDRGYGAFLVRDDKGNEGISATQKSHQQIVEHTEIFIDENCHRVNHPELLEDWKNFQMDDTEKFDLAMASGYALIAASRLTRKQQAIIKRKVTDLSRFQRIHKIRKNKIKLNAAA
jgi:hypothetical protein